MINCKSTLPGANTEPISVPSLDSNYKENIFYMVQSCLKCKFQCAHTSILIKLGQIWLGLLSGWVGHPGQWCWLGLTPVLDISSPNYIVSNNIISDSLWVLKWYSCSSKVHFFIIATLKQHIKNTFSRVGQVFLSGQVFFLGKLVQLDRIFSFPSDRFFRRHTPFAPLLARYIKVLAKKRCHMSDSSMPKENNMLRSGFNAR